MTLSNMSKQYMIDKLDLIHNSSLDGLINDTKRDDKNPFVMISHGDVMMIRSIIEKLREMIINE